MIKFSVTIGDLEIEVQELEDQHEHEIVQHKYPGQNGADLEWMGASPSEYRLKTTFIGQDAVADYVNLLAVLRRGATVRVEHPVRGGFDALVQSVTARYDERLDTAEVSFRIIEHGIGVEFVFAPHAEDLALEATQEAIDQGVCPDIAAQVAPAVLPADVATTDPNWLSQIYAKGLGNLLNAYVSAVATELGKVSNLRASILSPVSAAFNALSFTSDIPGQIAQQVAALLDAFATGRVEGAPDPVRAATNLVADMDALVRGFTGGNLESTVRTLAAMQAARTAASVLAADETSLRAQIALEQSDTFDLAGNYVGRRIRPEAMPATPDQVARLVSVVRAYLATAIAAAPQLRPLRTMAVALHRQYRDRLLQLENVREITVTDPTPLHLLCLRHGLPYNQAERLTRLNRLRNPTFTEGTVKIYVA